MCAINNGRMGSRRIRRSHMDMVGLRMQTHLAGESHPAAAAAVAAAAAMAAAAELSLSGCCSPRVRLCGASNRPGRPWDARRPWDAPRA